MKITIDRGGPTVEIQIESGTYLFDRETYNALFHAMLQEPADDVVWLSCVTKDLVSGNTAAMVEELNDYVAETVMAYSLRDN
jgi:hypothetical protein